MTARSSPARILQVHNHYRLAGGEDTVVNSHRVMLEHAGYEVRRFDPTNPVGAVATALQLGAAAWNPASARRIRSAVRGWRPQLAHVHNTWFSASPSVVTALRSEKVPVVMTLHNYRLTCINAQLLRQGRPCELCVGSSPWKGVQFRCYRGSYPASIASAATISLNRKLATWERGVDRFLVFTSFQRDIMVSAGLNPDRIEVVPNSVVDPGPRAHQSDASDMMLYVGRLSAEKGVDQLVDAWERVGPTGLKMVIVGDGPLRPALEARRVPGVEFRGQISSGQVRQLMLRARALLFPTIWYEGQPMVLLEALAAGLPVIAPRIGAVEPTLEDAAYWTKDSGWEATLEEVSDLGDAQLSSLSRAARERYEHEFTPEHTLNRLTDIYGEVLEKAGEIRRNVSE